MKGMSFLVVSLYLANASWNSSVNNLSSNLILLRTIGIRTNEDKKPYRLAAYTGMPVMAMMPPR